MKELEGEAATNHLGFDPCDLVIDIVRLSLGTGVRNGECGDLE